MLHAASMHRLVHYCISDDTVRHWHSCREMAQSTDTNSQLVACDKETYFLSLCVPSIEKLCTAQNLFCTCYPKMRLINHQQSELGVQNRIFFVLVLTLLMLNTNSKEGHSIKEEH